MSSEEDDDVCPMCGKTLRCDALSTCGCSEKCTFRTAANAPNTGCGKRGCSQCLVYVNVGDHGCYRCLRCAGVYYTCRRCSYVSAYSGQCCHMSPIKHTVE